MRVWILLVALFLPAAAGAGGQLGDDGAAVDYAVTGNKVEGDAAPQGERKARSPAVRELARAEREDHGRLEAEAAAMLARAGVALVETAQASLLNSGARRKDAELEALDGKEFDAAYVRGRVEHHRELLRGLDEALERKGRREPVAAYLRRARASAMEHLRLAEAVEAGLR